MKTSRRLVLIAFCTMAGLATCKKENNGNTAEEKKFDRLGMLKTLANNNILPIHKTLVINTKTLKQWTDSLCLSPTSANLTLVQNQWKETAETWKACEVFVFGKVQNSFISFRIDTWPTDTTKLNQALSQNETITDSVFSSFGLDLKGIPAIEYFIFNQTQGNQVVLDSFTTGIYAAQRKTYLTLLARDLLTNAENLLHVWDPAGQNYITEFSKIDGTEVGSPLGLLVNSMVQLLENTLYKRLALPLGNENNGVPQPGRVESPFGASSLDHVSTIVKSLEEIMSGKPPKNPGQLYLNNHLDACKAMYGNGLLSQKINGQIALINENIQAITNPLYKAVTLEKQKVETLKENIRTLLVLLKTDVASQLSITITLTDNDGD